MKDLFDEIDQERKELPHLKNIQDEVQKPRYHNFYQKLAFWLFVFLFVVSIVLGNLFPSCSETSNLFSTCTRTEYNLTLTVISWLISFVFCSMIYAVGEVISLLTSINETLKKRK